MKTFVSLEDISVDDIRSDFRESFNLNDEESLRNLFMTDNTSFTVIAQIPINPYSTEDDLLYDEVQDTILETVGDRKPMAYISSDYFSQKYKMLNMAKYLMLRGRINVSFFTIEKLWLIFCRKHNMDIMTSDNEKVQTFINWIKDLNAEDALKMDYYGNIK